MKTGYVIFAHGSSIESANDSVRRLAAEFAGSSDAPVVEAAFLEGGSPALDEAVGRLIALGVERVVVIPYFLTLGLHLQRDLPAMVARIAQRHPRVTIAVTPPLEGHPALVEILRERARSAV